MDRVIGFENLSIIKRSGSAACGREAYHTRRVHPWGAELLPAPVRLSPEGGFGGAGVGLPIYSPFRAKIANAPGEQIEVLIMLALVSKEGKGRLHTVSTFSQSLPVHV